MRFPLATSPALRPILAVLGMSPKSCFAEIDAERETLLVKAGIWFEETFSLREVAEVVPSRWPWWGGLGVKLGPESSVGVVTAGKGLVAVRFARPQAMHVLIAVHRSELRLSLESPEEFTRALQKAMAPARPSEATHPN